MSYQALSVQCLRFKAGTSSNLVHLVLDHFVDLLDRKTHRITSVMFPLLGINYILLYMLVYKNLFKETLLREYRNINYANSVMFYGFNNSITVTLDLKIDVVQLALQADVFAREMLNHKAQFDFKRFLGPYQVDWLRILHEAYIYDRIKCIYYGINLNSMAKLPENMHSFPGNIILTHLLSKNSFRYETGDSQPYSLYVKISYNSDPAIFNPIFEEYPDLRDGMSDNANIISYVNVNYEPVMKGLHYAKEYLTNKKKNGKGEDLFEIHEFNSSKIEEITTGANNPVANAFLNDRGDKFFFIMPYNESKPQALRFNASIFLPRAVGLTSSQLTLEGNNFYKVANRDVTSDIFTRDEVYSITGLKTEIIPLSGSQIKDYLGLNSYLTEAQKVKDELSKMNGGSDSSQQSPSGT